MNCTFCKYYSPISFFVKGRQFFFCKECGGIFLNPKEYLDNDAQKKRYLLHNNELNNEKYEKYLTNFIEPVLAAISPEPLTILDYGCGPVPSLVQLMKKKLPHSEIRGWDLFFSQEDNFYPNGADLVVCLEVVEHFESPYKDFEKLASSCKSGGYVVIGTILVPEKITDFETWWYKDDATHVSLYSLKALECITHAIGLKLEKILSPKIFLFKKL